MSKRLRTSVGGLAVALLALAALGVSAVHAGHVETRFTSSRSIDQADRSNAYYDCLTTEAHSLIHSDDVVYLPAPSLDQWTVLTKVIGGWARVTLDLKAANLALTLQRSSEPGTCNGDVLVTISRRPDGHMVIRRGLQDPS